MWGKVVNVMTRRAFLAGNMVTIYLPTLERVLSIANVQVHDG